MDEGFAGLPDHMRPTGGCSGRAIGPFENIKPTLRVVSPSDHPPQFTATDFLARLQELSDQNVQIAHRKNADYATDADPFANFTRSTLVGVSVEHGILVRMTDKLQRAANLLDKPASVKDESIDDTLADLSNYANILRIWLERK